MKPLLFRTLCAALASLMILGSLASCAVTGNPNDTTDPNADSSPAGSINEESTEGVLKDDIPDGTTFGGEEIVILSRYREGWTSGEIAVEELNNDLINDTVYERNKAVEARLDVKIVSQEENEHDPSIVMQKLTTSVTSGTHEYDLFACACYVSINQALSGTFMNLQNTEYLDLSKPWWAQGFNEAVEYQGTQYVATGSALLSMYRFAFVTVFNKEIFQDNNVPFLYDDVQNQTWTLDRQIGLVQTFHRDNGNGEQDEEGDIYGLVTNDYISVDPYWSACDVSILGRDETGSYELIFDSGKLFEVAEKTLKLFYESANSVYNYKHYGLDDEQEDIRDMFAADGAAMATLRILELENQAIRNMKSEYGVVPMPKFDEAQADYQTFLHDQVTVVSIPSSIAKNEERQSMVGALMEAMASDSHYTLRPAYYETTLRTKIAKDPESAEMMDLIINNVYIDPGILYTNALASFHDKFRQIMGSKTNTVTSDYKSIIKQVQARKLPEMLGKLDKLVDRGS